MGFYSTILFVLAMGILAFALFFTLRIAKQQKMLKGELDSKIPEAVQEHIFLKNPVFLSYALFLALVMLMIVFWATKTNSY